MHMVILEEAFLLGKSFFEESSLKKGQDLYLSNKLKLSFEKERAYEGIVALTFSGLVFQDSLWWDVQLSFRFTEKEGLSSLLVKPKCSCLPFLEKGQCAHAAALFYHVYVEKLRKRQLAFKDFVEQGEEEHGGEITEEGTGRTKRFQAGVIPREFGLFYHHAKEVLGLPVSRFDLGLFQLCSGQVISLPSPSPFLGTLVVRFFSNPYRVLYAYKTEKIHTFVSLFSEYSLFNWETGEYFFFENAIVNALKKIKMLGLHGPNDLFFVWHELVESGQVILLWNDGPLESVLSKLQKATIVANFFSQEESTCLEFFLEAENEKGNVLVQIPSALKFFFFQGGYLDHFYTKREALNFLEKILKTSRENWKEILTSSHSLNGEWKNFFTFQLQMLSEQGEDLICFSPQGELFSFSLKSWEKLWRALWNFGGHEFLKQGGVSSSLDKVLFKVFKKTDKRDIFSLYYDLKNIPLKVLFSDRPFKKLSLSPTIRRRSSQDWFELSFELSASDFELIQQLNKSKSSLFWAGEEAFVLDQADKKFLDFLGPLSQYKHLRPDAQGKITFQKNFSRNRIFEIFDLKNLGILIETTPEEEKIYQSLINLKSLPPVTLPRKLEGVLRPYQEIGVQWLSFLYNHRLGGCLADDMGLGKTIQTIAFLELFKDSYDRALVICPITILSNWQREFEKFSSFSPFIYHGPQRGSKKNHKIVITSYGILKKELEYFNQEKFSIVIFDEVQNLKNIKSQGAAIARQLQTQFRLCLTGTPLENEVLEFLNILDICLPGIWGEDFISKFRQLPNIRSSLARPFVLRRTKAAVLTDLPPKQEQLIQLDFSEVEKTQYLKLFLETKQRIEMASPQEKYGETLNGLLRLRQSCLWQSYKTSFLSTKVDFLVDQLDLIIKEGHNVLIFSQFTTYLDLIEKKLQQRHWPFLRLDGKTSLKLRNDYVDRFQKGECPIFLISLKAGGVGLNLTRANFIFIMDPWWNPAVEGQAIDRAHRIGQKNSINVYRLLIKNTVEEKVQRLKELKGQLFEEVMGDKDNRFNGKISMEDFRQLLE